MGVFYLLLSLEAGVHLGMVLVPSRAACILPGLWDCFGLALLKVILEGESPQENTRWSMHLLGRFVKVCWGRGPGDKGRMEAACLQSNMG